MPRLIITEQDKPEEQSVILGTEPVTLGRGEDNHVRLEEEVISRHHAKIHSENEQYFLTDLGSENGTIINGVPVKSEESHLLRNNDLIDIGRFHLRFWQTDEAVAEEIEKDEEVTDTDVLEIKLLKKVLDSIDQDRVPNLEVLNGSAEGKRFFLTDDVEEIVIGRDPNCDFPVNEYVISREHAKISKRWGGIRIRDLDSKNGSFINNKRIAEEHLHDGDRIALGTIVLLYRNPQEINLRELGEELSKKQKRKEERLAARQKEKSVVTEEGEEITPPPKEYYPAPQPASKQLNLYELGMIGLGVVVFLIALLTLINVILS